ncbi:MAG: hypothetical protein Q7U35_03390 [Methanobacteriaceae archaeon]|nr:hypothetical protein [Methanobacteriaceae archaeon]
MSTSEEELKAQLQNQDIELNSDYERTLSESEYESIKIALVEIVNRIAPGCVKVLKAVDHKWAKNNETPSLEDVQEQFFDLIDTISEPVKGYVLQRKVSTGGLYVEFDLRDNSCKAGALYSVRKFRPLNWLKLNNIIYNFNWLQLL